MFTHRTERSFSHRARFKGILLNFFRLSVPFLLLLLIVRVFELVFTSIRYGYPDALSSVILSSFKYDILFFLKAEFWIFWPFFFFYYFSPRLAAAIYVILAASIVLIQLGLVFYFLTAMVPLGADLFGYSMAEIKQTIGSAGSLNLISILCFLLLIALIVIAFRLSKKAKVSPFLSWMLAAVIFFVWLIPEKYMTGPSHFKNEFINNLTLDKSAFFYRNAVQYFFPPDNDADIYADRFIGIDSKTANENGIKTFEYVDAAQYPFLHLESTEDVLSPFFRKDSLRPDIVLLLVEGLGRAFSNEGAYLGSFTPFLDSLSTQSLYWSNFMSEGGRTFAVLPSVLGSLPFNKNGFCELGNNMPHQLSLMSLLKKNGYHTDFFYGGEAHFDFMDVFLKHQAIDTIHDISSFAKDYQKMPASSNGFSWGYGDKELFRHYFEVMDRGDQQPKLNVLLTLSTHSPFLVNQEDIYMKRFEERMNDLGFSKEQKAEHEKYSRQYASILFMDDALKYFFTQYQKRPEYEHTIFLITGDHRMPEIPMRTKIDRYHVPLIIFSPLLKRAVRFRSVSSHFDIAPSLLAFLKRIYGINIPTLADWMGTGLDTTYRFRNVHGYPYMQTKNNITDFIMGKWMMHDNELYRITPDMGLEPAADEQKMIELKGAFDRFRERNNRFILGASLIPDSIYTQYYPR